MKNTDSPIPSRPEVHRVGDVGETSVALLLKKWGWTADFIGSDYGEDLACDVFVNGKKTALHFRCQVKSTSSEKGQIRRLKSGELSVSISSSVCYSWAQSYYPVILAIYDEQTERIYWRIVSQLARDKAINLKSKTISIRVSNQELKCSKHQIESEISKFYSNLLNLSTSEYTCQIIPVLMPCLRSLSGGDLHSSHRENIINSKSIKPSFIDFEQSPSWITSIKSMDGWGLWGWTVNDKAPNLEAFFKKLEDIFLSIELPIKESEWVSYIVSPVKFQQSSESVSFWAKDLTGWSCHCIVNGECFSDFDYSFQLPDCLLQQIARHSRSWDGIYRIDTKLDLSFQVYSELATTPAYRESLERHNQQILGKFIPWTCRKDDLDVLARTINRVGLIFQLFDTESFVTEPGWVKGIISVPMFNPSVGLIPLSETWDEFESGDVMHRLAEHELLDKLPGKKGGEDIVSFVCEGFESLTLEAAGNLLIDESKYVDGMPLGHNGRHVLFQRFVLADGKMAPSFKESKLSIESKVRKLIGNEVTKFSVYVEIIEIFSEDILGVTVALEPVLHISTIDLVSKFKESIAQILTDVGFVSSPYSELTSVNILKKYGEIYFEGDSPWGIKRVEKED